MDNGDIGHSGYIAIAIMSEGDGTKRLGQNSLKAFQADFNSVLFSLGCFAFVVISMNNLLSPSLQDPGQP